MEKQKVTYITQGKLMKVEDLAHFELDFYSDITDNLTQTIYCLLIKMKTKNFIRVTLYPIIKPKVIKLSMRGHSIKMDKIEHISNEIKKFDIIHSTGLVVIEHDMILEFYLNLNQDDHGYKDLINLLDKHKNEFKDIKLEEIALDISM